jgi:hypothetical protein
MSRGLSERVWLILIFSLYALFGLGYSLLMPMWEGPDEHAHYHMAWSLARRGKLPPPHMNYETYQPALYYWLASRPLLLLDKIDPALSDFVLTRGRYFRNIGKPVRIFNWTPQNYRFLWGPQLLRWLNLITGGLALVFLYRGARLFIPGAAAVRLSALALAGLLPQFLHIVSTISNDALAILAGAILFWLLGKASCERLDRWQAALAASAALVLPVVVKLTVLPVGLAVLLALLFRAWQRRAAWQPRWGWLAGGGVLLGLGLLAGLFQLAPDRAEVLFSEFLWRGLSIRPDALRLDYLRPMFVQLVWSYWGKVGWLAVGLPGAVIALLAFLAAAGAAASLRPLLSSRARERFPAAWEAAAGRQAWIWLWVAAGLAILLVTKNGLTTPRNQGRFLFPANGALLLLVASGWFDLAAPRLQPYLLPLVILAMVALNLLLWSGGVIPVYYQPFLD